MKQNSYTEEVRRSVNENYGFEKLYSQGLSIRTQIKYRLSNPGNKVFEKRH